MKKLKSHVKVHLQDAAKRRRLIIGSGIFIAGFLAACVLSILQTPRYATGQEIEEARTAIIDQYINDNTVACTDTSDPVSPTGRIVVFYKYLRVNRYANRAVIRGCNNIDALLAKTKDGKWIRTEVNIVLDTRVSPRWQKACNITDITLTDEEKARPENASIDEDNFRKCMELRKL